MYNNLRMLSTTLLDGTTINQNLVEAQYAVRGPILDRANELQKQLKAGAKLPFTKTVSCNIGNPQALKQIPISYIRDVLAVVLCPQLLENPITFPFFKRMFANDVIEQAKTYLDAMPSIGAYSNSQGLEVPRQQVAAFITERDGHPSSPSNIFLTNGASEAVRVFFTLLIRNAQPGYRDGVLCPVPQYPLYSALCTLSKAVLIPYYLDESNNWGCSVESLKNTIRKARDEGTTVRALVVVNPGNPTGQVLSKENMQEIVTLCVEEGLLLLADEVYQENIWEDGKKFFSFKKVACDMGYTDTEVTQAGKGLQLISAHSISKGFLGECGLRGGYFELFGIPAAVRQQISKLASISLCSNCVGQLVVGMMCSLPKKGSPSYSCFIKQRDGILGSLKRRATKLAVFLNSLEGVHVNPPQGAMYAFPSITIPSRAIKAAQDAGYTPDGFYCMQLLDNTGVIVVPGSGFGQCEGSWHFRTTFLPSEEDMDDVMKSMSHFHQDFMRIYGDSPSSDPKVPEIAVPTTENDLSITAHPIQLRTH